MTEKWMSWSRVLAVLIGGGSGGLARFACAQLWGSVGGTTVVNLVGCFVLALTLSGVELTFSVPSWLILGIGTGFVGAFTTFSTLMVVSYQLLAGAIIIAGIVLSVNMVGGLLCAWFGYACGRFLVRRRHVW